MTKYHELRIVLPLSIEEYRVGHLYTRYQLKHRENQRSDTELAHCIPYIPPTPSTITNTTPIPMLLEKDIGLYTHHVHLFNGLLPQWVMTMLNGSLLKVNGKTWDEFPYIVSKYEFPPIARANIQIDFQHFDKDDGMRHNAFNLTPDQLTRRTIQHCDICHDSSIESPHADPKKYRYEGEHLLQRGPLKSTPEPTPSSPPLWVKSQDNFMCVYVLLSASFELPLAMLRNHAIELAINHFTQIVLELHRLAYVWLHEWDKFVVPFNYHPTPNLTDTSKDNSNDTRSMATTTTSTTNSRHPQLQVIETFMKDAVRNSPTITIDNAQNNIVPTPPRRIIDIVKPIITSHQPPKRGFKNRIQARL